MPKLCYWSIADGEWAHMLQALVASYHAVGMQEDFHAFSDRPIEGAITHPIPDFDKSFYHFKFHFLRNGIKELDYDYFVFLDADNLFVRKPDSFLHLLDDSPLHCFLESDCTGFSYRKEWHRCPLEKYVQLMRECGVESSGIYTVNAGFILLKHEAIDLVVELCMDFWKHCMMQGFLFTEEAPLAYATQMLCQETERHLLKAETNVWATDWTGLFKETIPEGQPWLFTDYFTHEIFSVNPAIVHLIKSKEMLIQMGKKYDFRGFCKTRFGGQIR